MVSEKETSDKNTAVYFSFNPQNHEKGLAGLKFSMEKQLGWKRPPGDDNDNDYDCSDIDNKNYEDHNNCFDCHNDIYNENDEDFYRSGEREDSLFDEVDDVWNRTSVMAEPLSCPLNRPLCPIVPGKSLDHTFCNSRSKMIHFFVSWLCVFQA